MDDYDQICKVPLRFKGEKKKKKKKSKSSGGDDDQQGTSSNVQPDERVEDADDHGGWWKTTKYEHIKNDVTIEFLPGCYAKALPNGKVVLGNLHPPGEGPEEEEIFTVICAGTNQVAFKSGFGRFLTIDKKKRLMGLSEAIGESETFLPVFEDGKTALSAHNDCFLSVDEESDIQQIVAKSMTAGPNEMLNIRVSSDPLRSDKQKIENTDQKIKPGDLGKVYEVELGYLKKTKNIDPGSMEEEKKRLKKARLEGQLREALLDTRVKHKSDKYCK